MAQLTAEQVERVIEACRTHLAELAETFRTSLDCDLRFSAAAPRPYAADALSPFDGPGLAVSLVLGEEGLLLLIPEPIPLPAWYREPGLSENNRLQTFAHELSLQLLPADLQADRYFAKFAPSLKEFAEQAEPNSIAFAVELPVFHAAAEAEQPIAAVLVIVPVNVSAVMREDATTRIEESFAAEGIASQSNDAELGSSENSPVSSELSPDARTDETGFDSDSSPDSAHTLAQPGMSLDHALRALRILNVPVTVSVRLAERKMPLGQVVALVPGALVPFNKSCEDLLDLFVNNHRYCQGEAIKIGENFGIKIAKVGVTEERKEHVL